MPLCGRANGKQIQRLVVYGWKEKERLPSRALTTPVARDFLMLCCLTAWHGVALSQHGATLGMKSQRAALLNGRHSEVCDHMTGQMVQKNQGPGTLNSIANAI